MSFKFKQFEIEDEHCAQKVGTDGVLIGAWCNVVGANSILDIGAGCGLVSLMIAQRTIDTKSHITAVELDADASKDCRLNFESSPWKERLKLVNADFATIDGCYDLIVSNPPFFAGDMDASGQSRMLARQGRTLTYYSLIQFAAKHLTDEGTLSFTSDVRHEKEIIFTAEINKLHLRRVACVSGKAGKVPIRFLWEFSKQNVAMPERTYFSHRNEDASYHHDYINLTKDFYLNM